jgi:hypothetical protein
MQSRKIIASLFFKMLKKDDAIIPNYYITYLKDDAITQNYCITFFKNVEKG